MGTKLYVGNLPHGANEAILRMAFGQDGRKVESVEIVLDEKTGKSKRFGYVEMGNYADAQSAIEKLNGSDLDGRVLSVNEGQARRVGGKRRA